MCLNLTYERVQTHDKRLDRAIRDADYLLELLNSRKVKQRLLGLRAVAKLRSFLGVTDPWPFDPQTTRTIELQELHRVQALD